MSQLTGEAPELFQFFELTPDFVCISGKDGFFRHVNQAVVLKLGYSRQELLAVPISTFIHPDDREITSARRAELLNGIPLTDFYNRYVTKTGETIWLHWTTVYLPEKELAFAIAKDVTRMKISELRIEENYNKFKSLAHHFKRSLEHDKKFLAVELHEELAQLASVVRMDIDWLKNNNENWSDAANARLNHAVSVSEMLINAIRRISYQISPNMLENIGLVETLRWLAEEFASLNGIPCDFRHHADVEHLTHEIKLDLYRICQEALNNVLCHAEASAVSITVEPRESGICLSITDNGKGFNPASGSLTSGLTAISERVASMNGQLNVRSQQGRGTTVEVFVDPQVLLPN